MKADRFLMGEVKPNAFNPLIQLNKDAYSSTLTEAEVLLIYIRASQINGCAYCIQSHIKEAVEKGEKQYRIHALNAWDHSHFFTDEEKIILQMTEEITLISEKGLTNNLYEKALDKLGKEKIADIIMAVATINAWNRVGVSTLLEPIKSQE